MFVTFKFPNPTFSHCPIQLLSNGGPVLMSVVERDLASWNVRFVLLLTD